VIPAGPELTRLVPDTCRRILDVGSRTGPAAAALRRLAAEGERFDAIVFAGVLERLADPVEALTLARSLAEPGAALVASVPNVGHVSVVRDLARGRFDADPVPAGFPDRNLRWFTRRSLVEALEEAGWTVESVQASSGEAPAGAAEFLALVEGWPSLDRESLAAARWVALARAGWTGRGPDS